MRASAGVAAAHLSKHGISAGPVVAILAIVAALAVIVVVVVSYVIHHRASQGAARWATQFGSNPPFSSEAGRDEVSR